MNELRAKVRAEKQALCKRTALVSFSRQSPCPFPSSFCEEKGQLGLQHRVGSLDLPFVYSHELRYESFEVDDDFTACPDAVFVERAPFHNFGLDAVIDLGHELECQSLQQVSE